MSRFTWNALVAAALAGALVAGGYAGSARAAEPLTEAVGCIGLRAYLPTPGSRRPSLSAQSANAAAAPGRARRIARRRGAKRE